MIFAVLFLLKGSRRYQPSVNDGWQKGKGENIMRKIHFCCKEAYFEGSKPV